MPRLGKFKLIFQPLDPRKERKSYCYARVLVHIGSNGTPYLARGVPENEISAHITKCGNFPHYYTMPPHFKAPAHWGKVRFINVDFNTFEDLTEKTRWRGMFGNVCDPPLVIF